MIVYCTYIPNFIAIHVHAGTHHCVRALVECLGLLSRAGKRQHHGVVVSPLQKSRDEAMLFFPPFFSLAFVMLLFSLPLLPFRSMGPSWRSVRRARVHASTGRPHAGPPPPSTLVSATLLLRLGSPDIYFFLKNWSPDKVTIWSFTNFFDIYFQRNSLIPNAAFSSKRGQSHKVEHPRAIIIIKET